jgi:hypothetical protein
MSVLWVLDCGVWYYYAKGTLADMQALARTLESEGEQTRLRGR